MGYYQDESQCNCKKSEICPPPDGDNGGDPIVGEDCSPNSASMSSGGGGGGAHWGLQGVPSFFGNNPPPPGPPITGERSSSDPTGFDDIDENLEYYDPQYNIQIQNDQSILQFANVKEDSSIGAPVNFFSSVIDRPLNSLVQTLGGMDFVGYTGTTLGSLLYNSALLRKSFSSSTNTNLSKVQDANLTSVSIDPIFLRSFREAIVDGSLEGYTDSLFREIYNNSPSLSYIDPNNNNNKISALKLIKERGLSLNPKRYNNPTDQRLIQRRRYIYTDLDVTLPITTRSKEITGARFTKEDTIRIVKQDGTFVNPKAQNEFLPIVKQDNSKIQVSLKSNRDRAYYFNSGDLSIIESLLGVNSSPTVEASCANVSVELNEGGTTIPEAALFSAVLSSITDTSPLNSDIRTTQIKYKRAWKSGDSDTLFNSTVSAFSGPRASVDIDSKDSIWKLMQETDSNGDVVLTLTFSDLNPSLLKDGRRMVIPRNFLTDILISPVSSENKTYNAFSGKSMLTGYSETSGVTRQISLANSPIAFVGENDYTKTVLSSSKESIEGKEDEFAFHFEKEFTEGDLTDILSTDKTALTSGQSAFSLFVSAVGDVSSNYNLDDGAEGRRLPLSDLLSFFPPNTYLDFIMHTSEEIKFNFIEGLFTSSIKLFPVAISDVVKTFISEDRLTGTSMESIQLQKTTPPETSFPPKYRGKLWQP